MKLIRVFLAVFALMMYGSLLEAQIPRIISYQGVIADINGTPKPNGAYGVVFRLYAVSSGGSALWTESKSVSARRGLFSTMLGDATPIPDSVKFEQPYWLGITVGSDPELTPRTQFSSTAYSFSSIHADSARIAGAIGNGAVTGSKIADGQVVKSLNNLHDALTMRAEGGATITSSGDTIIINSGSGGGGTGIQGVQNTDNTLSISNPNGPTATINTQIPFTLNGQDALRISGYQPFLTLLDANAGSARTRIQNANGNLAFFTEADFSSGLPALAISSSGSRLTVLGQDAVNIVGYQPFVTLADANSGYARARIQNANGDIAFFTQSDFASGLPALTLKSAGTGSRLQILGQDGLNTVGYEPFLTLTDSYNNQYARARVQCANGDLNLWAESGLSSGAEFIVLKTGSGNVGIGTANPTARLEVAGHTKTNVLEITGGSDLAEPFETDPADLAEPGSVMVIDPDHPGRLKPADSPYDQKVAGIVSGAGEIRPGLTLRQAGVMEGNSLVAIAGRVYCRAEAYSSPIEPGDLLTTSSYAGCAMKVTEKSRAQGAVIGKAMSGLKSGRGLVLVLVNLQ